ncbi:thioesterase II family protein [Kribbella sp. CA-294648]|uniref:thioesterase II family protein n=1 Tax=Kribbella sp. CA-294648 TaxID=3239948 RepID=UPI003D89C8A0
MGSQVPEEADVRERLRRLGPSSREQLIRRLRASATASPTAWFGEPSGNQPFRLFCFPYAGGGGSVFRSWQELMPEGIDLMSARLPGREERSGQVPVRKLPALIDLIHAAIEPLLDRPFALFGHSMGALLAFELARKLRQEGSPCPQRLFLSAFRAPHLPNPNIAIHHLPDEVLKTVLVKDGTPAEIVRNEDIMRALLPTLRADLELCETYQYADREPLDIPISAFGGLQDVRVLEQDLMQWKVHTASEFHLTMFQGGHFFIHSAQDLLVSRLAGELRACLDHQ